jgi:hypothetical protein
VVNELCAPLELNNYFLPASFVKQVDALELERLELTTKLETVTQEANTTGDALMQANTLVRRGWEQPSHHWASHGCC